MMKRVNWHGVAAVVTLFMVWRHWLINLDRNVRLGWCAAIVSVIYGVIIVINAIRTPDDVDPEKHQHKALARHTGSFGAHLFLLLVIIFNWHTMKSPLPKTIPGPDELIFSVIAALLIGIMIPYMVVMRDLPRSPKTP